MPNAHLTDLSVQRLPSGLYFDTKTPAFGIRVGKRRRTWLVVKGARRTKIILGHYPTMSLHDARQRALVMLGTPLSTRRSVTFSEARTSFLALDRWRPSTKRVIVSNLKKFQWQRPLEKITRDDVLAVLSSIGRPGAREQAFKDVRCLFNWCVPTYIDVSPCVGIKLPRRPSRARVLTHDEVKAVWQACEGTFGAIVKLLLLTGQRKMEVGRLRQEYLRDDLITLPATVTKNGREHVFPVGPLASSLLPARSGYLFRASSSDGPYNGFTYHLRLLQRRSGTSNWTLHDLRRTFASLHAERGTPLHVVEKYLNHVSGSFSGVAGIYNRHGYVPEMRAACVAHEDFIRQIVQR